MSTTPTPSVSSDQTQYFDALVMQFPPHTNDATGEPRSNSVGLRLAASGNSSGGSQPSSGEGTAPAPMHAGVELEQEARSLRSLPTEAYSQGQQVLGTRTVIGFGSSLGRRESTRTAKSTHNSGTTSFVNGGPLTGPNAEPDVDQSFFIRGARAERSLSQKQKDQIAKVERKESKKLSKLLKTESTTEKVALDSALKTLAGFQSLHRAAIKREMKAEVSHARALSAVQKAESRFHEEKARTTEQCARAETRCTEERARWEGKEVEVRAQQERLISAKNAVKETEIRMAGCAREVERLRIVKATDERERTAKIAELVNHK